MTRKKAILLAIVSFILGVGVMYWYSGKELGYKHKSAWLVIDSFAAESKIDTQLINNYGQVIQEIGTCLLQGDKICNPFTLTDKLSYLNGQKTILEQGKKKITNEFQLNAKSLEKEKMLFQR